MSYSKIDTLSKVGNTEIAKVYYPRQETVACAKIMKARNMMEANKFVQEVFTHSWLREFPNAIQFYDGFLEQSEDNISVVIIMEYCSKGDLNNLLESRSLSNQFYSDEEILSAMRNFIYLLKELQLKNFCHRDIKPENIFISEEGIMKLGDFGEAKIIITHENLTLRGSPYYLSPKLRMAYSEFLQGRSTKVATHNPFKSDSYSLGLVFLYMATMQKIDESFTYLDTLSGLIWQQLAKIKNYFIKTVIGKMLCIEENERLDFVEIYNLLEKIDSKSACISCWEECSEIDINCMNCGYKIHRRCLWGKECLNCLQSLGCKECNGTVNEKTKCFHGLCEECRIMNLGCFECLGIKIIDSFIGNIDTFPEEQQCRNCTQIMTHTESQDYYCKSCNMVYCKICKNVEHHLSSCLNNISSRYVVCRCSNRCITEFPDLFFQCQRCGDRCIVCMKLDREASHINCSILIQNREIIS